MGSNTRLYWPTLDSKVLLGIPRKYSLPFYGSHQEKSGYFYASKYSI